MQSTQLRTKEDVDHAGPSLPPLLLRDTTLLSLDLSSVLLSKSLLTATPDLEDAMVDGRRMPWNMPKDMDKSLRETTHILVEMVGAST